MREIASILSRIPFLFSDTSFSMETTDSILPPISSSLWIIAFSLAMSAFSLSTTEFSLAATACLSSSISLNFEFNSSTLESISPLFSSRVAFNSSIPSILLRYSLSRVSALFSFSATDCSLASSSAFLSLSSASVRAISSFFSLTSRSCSLRDSSCFCIWSQNDSPSAIFQSPLRYLFFILSSCILSSSPLCACFIVECNVMILLNTFVHPYSNIGPRTLMPPLPTSIACFSMLCWDALIFST